ncbi:anaerobic ribonucleoside-triphosphate reductase activating protein [Cellulomonas soli]|uniref:Anaerobic ribonucleoside-triphosphate reductase activating protein n=1 Tax=Cellulomonas soli TaxID=931535 RepID=A0A512PGD8_9CELL|nr:anaerobic ribonucleoside-triphosphate reductase activating protein [Cellulomonas soli]NYI58120.1 pyruvate formate lyase activating enzyme [Cellulomonas soli]GEP70254.1 anaerobic ribonucleoside-triphosphate reductase activating protein [Cellulomonas soli]
MTGTLTPDGSARALPLAGPSVRPQVRPPCADDLAIAGLTAMSSCDWPGRLVATAFLQGCPWRCTYCHNVAILDPRTPGVVPWSDVTGLLDRRHGLLDGLVLSGGEPTRQAGLVDAAQQVRARGFGVGLHTSGAYPGRLAAVLPHVDWVGFDVKAPAHLYRAITQVGRPTTTADRAFASLRLVLDSGVEVQVRTTVDPTVLGPDDVTELTAVLADLGVRDHVLQEVRPDGTSEDYRAALTAARGEGA